jgi:ParB family chromosome partitioning protein
MSQGLGRGLGSLIPKKTVVYGQNPFKPEIGEEDLVVMKDDERILKVSPENISINPQQPRTHFAETPLQDLAASIREHGIIQPLIVSRKGNSFELIAGERRLRASKIVGLKEVPVIVREEKEQKKLELALIENLQRENLNPLETAVAYQRLMDEFSLTQEEAAKKVGKARSSVANCLRLLSLPEEAQAALASGKISEAHAKYLLGLEGREKQVNVLRKIIRQNLTVAETDKEIRRLGGTKAAKAKNYSDEDKENVLSAAFGTKVEIKRSARGGKLLFSFYSDEELHNLMKNLTE